MVQKSRLPRGWKTALVNSIVQDDLRRSIYGLGTSEMVLRIREAI